ncbi:MAG: ABC transporter ATP-binding protein [Bacteroidales bacterium]|nr:ABC transporter ATP-binding protein [Bacteroidales bacterium]
MEITTILEVKNLVMHFKQLKAVDDLSFSVQKGDIYGFLGPNGSGKSTTLRMLLSLIYPQSGMIKVFGKDLSRETNVILSKIGALVEKPEFYNYLSAYKNLEILMRYCGQSYSKAYLNDILDLVGLGGRIHSKVDTYSQGMKQRLGIAQALIHKPDLLMLDEPVNGLDPQGIKDIRDLLINLNQEKGITILISSHILKEIEVIANRMLVINNGKSIAEGEVKTLIGQQFNRVKLEIKSPDKVYSCLKASKYSDLIYDYNNLKEIILEIDKEEIPELNRFLVSEKVDVLSIQKLNSLEDFVLDIT